ALRHRGRTQVQANHSKYARRGALAASVSAIALAGLAFPAFAADAPPPGDEVVVTGLRGSLQRSLDAKRNSLDVGDAISAEDIGKFPDGSRAAALQRAPGV